MQRVRQCHAQLRTRDGQPHYVASITDFDEKHPEFAPLRSGAADPAGIRLNHYVHLQPNLIGPNNTRVQMTCDDCHRTASVRNVAVRDAELHPVAATVREPRSLPTINAYMPVPEFAKHCSGCHTLQFDMRFGNEQVPHDKPEAVHAFLLKRFGEYIAAHPGSSS